MNKRLDLEAPFLPKCMSTSYISLPIFIQILSVTDLYFKGQIRIEYIWQDHRPVYTKAQWTILIATSPVYTRAHWTILIAKLSRGIKLAFRLSARVHACVHVRVCMCICGGCVCVCVCSRAHTRTSLCTPYWKTTENGLRYIRHFYTVPTELNGVMLPGSACVRTYVRTYVCASVCPLQNVRLCSTNEKTQKYQCLHSQFDKISSLSMSYETLK